MTQALGSSIDKRDLMKLKFTFIKSILMKRSKLNKEKYKLYRLSRKEVPKSGMELSPAFKEINRLRE